MLMFACSSAGLTAVAAMRRASRRLSSSSSSSSSSSLIIVDEESFTNKVALLIEGGASKLLVISDYDRTLTKNMNADGARGKSAYGVVESCPALDSKYRAKANALFQKYHPIEIDPGLTVDEKLPHMKQWYRKSHQLLVKQPLLEEHLQDAVARAKLEFRPGVRAMLTSLRDASVPLLVFSAGLGNVIDESLEQEFGRAFLDELQLQTCANRIHFLPGGSIDGGNPFSEPLIHMYNKGLPHLLAKHAESAFVKAVFPPSPHRTRRHAILLGDSTGDATMAEGLDFDVVLRVGFLNERVDESLPLYQEKFDCIITHDGDMDSVVDLLRRIVASK